MTQPKKWRGYCAPYRGGELGPYLKQCSMTATAIVTATCDFMFTIATVLRCNCDATETKNRHVLFSARSHEVAGNHNAGISMGVAIRLVQFL